MKIIQINVVQSGENSTLVTKIFGLGEDNKVYQWNVQDGTWSLYSQLRG